MRQGQYIDAAGAASLTGGLIDDSSPCPISAASVTIECVAGVGTVRNTVRVGVRGLKAVAWTQAILTGYALHRRVRADLTFDPYLRRWADGILHCVGARVHADAVPPATRARLVVSNHRSALDIPLLLKHFGGVPVSRGDLESWPLLGRGARNAGAVFVHPEDPRGRAAAIRAIRERLSQGRTVNLFAEGTTFAGDEVRPFYPGGLAACRGLDVEILPVGLAYAPGTEYVEDNFMDHVRALAQRVYTDVVMTIGPPLPIVTPFRSDQLANEARAAVQELVAVSRRRFDALGSGSA